ncbi:hypothetical protein F6Y05_35185 [Bacillus megaterium]|nr:hypothetical protein [Priestia megaterium]
MLPIMMRYRNKKKKEEKEKEEKEKQEANNQEKWAGVWTRDINTDWADIEVTKQKGDTLKFSINSMHTDNAEAARGGYINIGEVKGTAKVSGNVATQITDEIGSGCMVKLTNHQSYIQVEYITDCSSIGGVYFDGKYKKVIYLCLIGGRKKPVKIPLKILMKDYKMKI